MCVVLVQGARNLGREANKCMDTHHYLIQDETLPLPQVKWPWLSPPCPLLNKRNIIRPPSIEFSLARESMFSFVMPFLSTHERANVFPLCLSDGTYFATAGKINLNRSFTLSDGHFVTAILCFDPCTIRCPSLHSLSSLNFNRYCIALFEVRAAATAF